jgi:hypothetical protein
MPCGPIGMDKCGLFEVQTFAAFFVLTLAQVVGFTRPAIWLTNCSI